MARAARLADAETASQLAAKGITMTVDQLKRKLRNFPTAKLTRLAVLTT